MMESEIFWKKSKMPDMEIIEIIEIIVMTEMGYIERKKTQKVQESVLIPSYKVLMAFGDISYDGIWDFHISHNFR